MPLPDLLERGLQLLLPLLCLLQHRLPAGVQLLQAVPQAAGIVPRAGLQQLVACFVHRLHGGLVGQDVVLQHLHEVGKRWTPLLNAPPAPGDQTSSNPS